MASGQSASVVGPTLRVVAPDVVGVFLGHLLNGLFYGTVDSERERE